MSAFSFFFVVTLYLFIYYHTTLYIEDDAKSMPEPSYSPIQMLHQRNLSAKLELPIIHSNKRDSEHGDDINVNAGGGINSLINNNNNNNYSNDSYLTNLTIRIKNDTFMARLSKPKWWMDGRFSHIPNKVTCKVSFCHKCCMYYISICICMYMVYIYILRPILTGLMDCLTEELQDQFQPVTPQQHVYMNNSTRQH